MLVGMNPKGELTGVIVTDHREPYGYFSVDLPEWPRQFVGKSIRDAFKVGTDVDAITRATITVTSASRAIRNASRKAARAHLAPPSAPAAGTAPAAATTAQ
jgi:Na+-translocating ferredoxin:NAD+ oxidoreductase RnfG subunit